MITKELNINELYRVFDLLNKGLFDNKLEKSIILIESTRKNIMGHCTVNRLWANKNIKKGKGYYEISISAEHLNRPIEGIVATLLHEMIHLHCSLNDIKDTSNNHVYHNKRFKIEAENHGLIIEFAPTIGWSVTTLQDSAKVLIKTFKINEKLFEHYRNTPRLPKLTTPIRNKYKCPCGVTISSIKELNIICGYCKKPFEVED